MDGGSSERHWSRLWRASEAAVGNDAPHESQISRRRHAALIRRCRHRLLNCVYDLRHTSHRNGFSIATAPAAIFVLLVSSWKRRRFSFEVSFSSSLTLTGNGTRCAMDEMATRPDIIRSESCTEHSNASAIATRNWKITCILLFQLLENVVNKSK